MSDIYSGVEWTPMADADLRRAIESGMSIAEATTFLCGDGGVEEVADQAVDLAGATWILVAAR
jgi:hypothetical protein